MHSTTVIVGQASWTCSFRLLRFVSVMCEWGKQKVGSITVRPTLKSAPGLSMSYVYKIYWFIIIIKYDIITWLYQTSSDPLGPVVLSLVFFLSISVSQTHSHKWLVIETCMFLSWSQFICACYMILKHPTCSCFLPNWLMFQMRFSILKFTTINTCRFEIFFSVSIFNYYVTDEFDFSLVLLI